jgi:hypothetical protein
MPGMVPPLAARLVVREVRRLPSRGFLTFDQTTSNIGS